MDRRELKEIINAWEIGDYQNDLKKVSFCFQSVPKLVDEILELVRIIKYLEPRSDYPELELIISQIIERYESM